MKKLLLSLTAAMGFTLVASAQCTLTNATTCKCSDTTNTDCDLLPDIQIARLPLTQSSNYTEYAQVCNPPCSGNDGRLRFGVSTPIIGFGPLETRGTSIYVCGTDTIDAGTVAAIPTACPTTGVPPHQLIKQRIYHKTGNAMTFTDRAAGSMTYHPTHGHQHVDDWGIYTLRTATADPNPVNWPIIGTGTKLGFCLLDIGSCTGSAGYCTDSAGTTITSANFNTNKYRNYGLGGGSYGCSNTVQGISNGYMDTYSQSLDGMWIVIPPGTCNGTYYVVVQIDPHNYFTETNENNNVIAIPFTLTKQAGTAVSISTSGSTSFCQGGSVTLTATGGALNYLWSNGATTQSIVASASGSFTVSANTTTSCPTTSSPVSVNVTPMNVTAASSPLSICPGQSVQLSTTTNASSTASSISSTTNNTQVMIPDNNATGVTSNTTISGISPSTLSANSIVSVTLNLTHTYDADLIISLISPSGNTIALSSQRGGSGDNFTNTIFTMNAATAIASGSAPFTGSYVPDGAFSSLTGNANGVWKLKVADVAAVDTGRIVNWTLKINNTVSNVVTYNWSSNPSGFSSTSSSPSATPSATTAYTVSASDLNGCVGSSTVNVIVNPNPVVTITGTVSICAGASTTLTASGASTYLWSDGSTTASINVSPASTTTYSVTGTTSGCSGSNSVTVTVNSNPVVTISPSTSICAGASTTLTASGASTYLWSDGSTTASINVSPASTTTYSVTGTTSGCSGSNSTTVTVNPNPVITVSPAVSICAGASTSLAASFATSYLWTPGGETTSAIIVSPSSTTTYTVTGTTAGCSGSNSVTVTVNPNPVVSSSSSAVSCFGGSNGSAIAVVTGGTSPYTYLWNSSPAQTTATASNLPFGTYSVNISDANGCITSTSQSVSQPAAALSTSGTVTNSTCGTSNGGVDITPLGGTSPYTYSWSPGGAATQDISGVSGGNYSVLVTDANGCANSQPFTVGSSGTAPSAPASVTGNIYICKSTTGNLYNAAPVAGATSYVWTVPTGATIGNGQGTGTLSVNFSATQASGNVCVYAANGCGNSAPVCKALTVVTVKPTVPSAINGSIYACAGSSGNAYSCPAVPTAESYTWTLPTGAVITSGAGTNSIVVTMPSPFSSGSLRVTADNCKGMSSQKVITIYGTPTTPSIITGSINEVCPGTAGVAYSIPSIVSASSYTWSAPANATIASGQGTPSVTVDYNALFNSGNLSVTASNVCGTSAARTAAVRSVPAQPGSITGAATICANQTGVGFSIVAATGATSYVWTVPATATIASGQGTISIVVNFGSSGGTVSVKGSNACGLSTVRTKTVTVNCRVAEPVADLSIFPNPAHDEVKISFSSNAEGTYHLSLCDITGRVIYSTNHPAVEGSNSIELRLSDFAKGVYMLSFEMNKEQLVKKIVVQ